MSDEPVDPVIAGAVLTGGASRRMGRDKAFVEVEGQPMVLRVAEALRSGGCASVVAVGGDRDRLRELGLDAVPDGWPGEGPLGGLVTALVATARDTVVAATDLPFLSPSSVATLIATAIDDPDADVVMARSDREEPLCALWRHRTLAHLRARLDLGERAVHRAALGLRVRRVAVPAPVMHNVNRPDDLTAPSAPAVPTDAS